MDRWGFQTYAHASTNVDNTHKSIAYECRPEQAIKDDTNKDIKRIKSQIEKDIEQSMLRRINNYNLISSQMENNLKNDMKKHIMEKAIKYTEIRIKKNLSNKQNLKLVENSIINIPKNFF